MQALQKTQMFSVLYHSLSLLGPRHQDKTGAARLYWRQKKPTVEPILAVCIVFKCDPVIKRQINSLTLLHLLTRNQIVIVVKL